MDLVWSSVDIKKNTRFLYDFRALTSISDHYRYDVLISTTKTTFYTLIADIIILLKIINVTLCAVMSL